ncbi:hypothetical protein PTTG_03932 [Puccinia triticina 1-1 BBBD Race 1]|uniref:Prolyl 4-hydroxylase alpha subunit Fe(2+) 2OG dioxygenase domain-containing protein n=1 Tax=Puccinia triticina (isolate 1-1 / race 1 (BBBD)) TaxID=630390 RepID=A0A180GIM4_PUCT1|nr:hypothetical protein PTTG_03932 [Puccinia triticina 1-1 BBBD Race 1]
MYTKERVQIDASINNCGTFAGWEALPTTPPAGFLLDGIGEIDLPLREGQVRQLIAKAHPAPSGRAGEPIANIPVPHAWELGRDQLFFLEPTWQAYLVDLTHTGGEVVVTYNDQSKTLKTSDANQYFACWYSDVSHEVLPVQSGYRCVLTYNLAIRPSHDHPRPAGTVLDSKKEPLRNGLERWLRDLATGDARNVPSHLYHALDHKYAEDNMSIEKLKAEDFIRIRALQNFARELPFEIFFAVLEQQKDGTVHRARYRVDKRTGCYTDSESYASHHEIGSVIDTSHAVKSLRTLDGTIIASDFDFDLNFCLVKEPFRGLKTASEDYEYMGNSDARVTHWYRRSAVVITTSMKGANPPAKISTLLCATLVDSLKLTDILKSALEYSHCALFQTVGVCHRGHLPVEFFDWAKGWLDTLSDTDRSEKYQKWIPLLIQGYSSMAESIKIIKRLSNPTGDAAVPDGSLSSMGSWAKDVTHRCIMSFPEANKKPTLSDAESIVSAVFDLNETWTGTSALLTSIFDRFPQADATAFLIDVLFRLKIQAKLRNIPSDDTMELYRSLSLRVSNNQRKFCGLVTTAKAKLTSNTGQQVSFPAWAPSDYKRNNNEKESSQTGLVVTPRALVDYVCDIIHLSTDTVNPLQQFIQEITAQCDTFSAEDLSGLWMPFLYQLIPALALQSVSLNTPIYQQLTRQFVKHSEDKIIGPYPQVVNFTIPHVDCSCTDCKDLNQFLQNTSQGVGRFRMSEARRQHLSEQLKRAHVECTRETAKGCSPYTLLVTKVNTFQDKVKEWEQKRIELYGALTRHISQEHLQSLLGTEEATRFRTLAEARHPATAPHSHR